MNMSDNRNPDEIEREIEKEREGLTRSIHELQDTFSSDNLIHSVTDNFRTHGGDIGKSVGAAARENPLALALTGIGLTWLIFGRGPSSDRLSAAARHSADDDMTLYGERRTAYGATATSGTVGPRSAVPAGDGPNWIRDEDRGPSATQRARAGWRNTSAAAGERFRSGGRSLSHGAHAAGDSMSHGAGRIRDRSQDMANRLSEGTQHLGEGARERVIQARERAIAASEQASRSMSRGADRAADFFEDHPLVGGAIAFAVGAAVAGALPRTRYEDEHFGEESDRLYHEAERIFEEERAKAQRVAGAALDEAGRVGDEAKQDADKAARSMKDQADSEAGGEENAADATADRVEDAARRVSEAAGNKAREEDLGKPRT